MVFLLPCVNVYAAQPTEYEVKVAFLHNIVKFIDWPSGSVDEHRLRLCIVGESPFTNAASLLEGKPIGQRVWAVRQLNSRESSSGCQVLFISDAESADLKQVLSRIQARGILTVGDSAGYAEQGVMINFYQEQDKIRFEINLEAAHRAGFQISSQLLRLARIVRETGSRP